MSLYKFITVIAVFFYAWKTWKGNEEKEFICASNHAMICLHSTAFTKTWPIFFNETDWLRKKETYSTESHSHWNMGNLLQKTTQQQCYSWLLQLLSESSYCSNKVTHPQSHTCILSNTGLLYNTVTPVPCARTPGGVLKIVCDLLLRATRRALMSSRWEHKPADSSLHASTYETHVQPDTPSLVTWLMRRGARHKAHFSVYTQDSWYSQFFHSTPYFQLLCGSDSRVMTGWHLVLKMASSDMLCWPI